MKKLTLIFAMITAILLVSICFALELEYDGITTTYEGLDVSLVLNNTPFTPSEDQMPPIILDNRTLVPVREVFEALGGLVDWDSANRKVTVTFSSTTIELTINSTTAMINGEPKELDVPAKIINNKTMVPVRFISENGGLIVDWNSETRTVSVNAPVNSAEEEPTTNLAVNAFNNKYIKYLGEDRGIQAAYQLTNLIYTNCLGNTRFINVDYYDGENHYVGNSPLSLLEIMDQITSTKRSSYNIEGEYDEEGYLTNVNMTKEEWESTRKR